uniref:IS4 family transposase n=1 Tax=Glycomyces salinus TaxID=980294 RepID=UPI0018EBAF2A
GAASGVFAPGHLGELTRIVPFETVDAALEQCRAHQRRLRSIPSRVVVYLLLASGLFASVGWMGIWRKLRGGLGPARTPAASALWEARTRVGPGPLKVLFELLAGPTTGMARWRGLAVCAIDGTLLDIPASKDNLSVHRSSGATRWAGAGYPQVRLLALVAAGSRAVIAAAFGPVDTGETKYAARLTGAMGAGQIILADRGFDAAALIEAIRGTGAHLLVRMGARTKPVRLHRLRDGTWLVRRGTLILRLIEAEITIATTAGTQTGHYRLLTSAVNPRRYPADQIVALYHQRWEIETAYAEFKSTLLRRRVLRGKHPGAIDQEIWALLTLYQAIRIAIADAVIGEPIGPLQASFTIALETARDQLIRAANLLDDEQIDLKGVIGQQILAHPLPERRLRKAPRVVKRAISKYHARSNHIDRRTYKATLDIIVYADP